MIFALGNYTGRDSFNGLGAVSTSGASSGHCLPLDGAVNTGGHGVRGSLFDAPQSGIVAIDMDTPGAHIGAPVKASCTGEVIHAGPLGDCGHAVRIKCDPPLGGRSKVCHLCGVSVSVGQRVTAGQVVGGLGNTGKVKRSDGTIGFLALPCITDEAAHVHHEVVDELGIKYDPRPYACGNAGGPGPMGGSRLAIGIALALGVGLVGGMIYWNLR
mgnify:CR=1 FL=1